MEFILSELVAVVSYVGYMPGRILKTQKVTPTFVSSLILL